MTRWSHRYSRVLEVTKALLAGEERMKELTKTDKSTYMCIASSSTFP